MAEPEVAETLAAEEAEDDARLKADDAAAVARIVAEETEAAKVAAEMLAVEVEEEAASSIILSPLRLKGDNKLPVASSTLSPEEVKWNMEDGTWKMEYAEGPKLAALSPQPPSFAKKARKLARSIAAPSMDVAEVRKTPSWPRSWANFSRL